MTQGAGACDIHAEVLVLIFSFTDTPSTARCDLQIKRENCHVLQLCLKPLDSEQEQGQETLYTEEKPHRQGEIDVEGHHLLYEAN